MSIRNKKDDEYKTPNEELLDAIIEQRDTIPLPRQESEDELWNDVHEKIMQVTIDQPMTEAIMGKLQEKFTIKRK